HTFSLYIRCGIFRLTL
ncbi:hypothetical protein SLA2020_522600, partial [Shorea laevis]